MTGLEVNNAITFKNTLPEIPIPLAEPDADVPIDLGSAVADVYERGGYATLIDYNRLPPPPQLDDEDAKWIDALLRERGVRSSNKGTTP